MELENKYRKAEIKMNSLARKNQNCREDKGLVSCYNCPLVKTCDFNGYDQALKKAKEIGQKLSSNSVLRIREELRNA